MEGGGECSGCSGIPCKAEKHQKWNFDVPGILGHVELVIVELQPPHGSLFVTQEGHPQSVGSHSE